MNTQFKTLLNAKLMKKYLLLTTFLTILASGGSLWAQYGIGTNTPNASAALEIVSPDKGVLIPSVSLTSTVVFAPITGTSSTTHNGMIIWNESTSTANGLTGEGFYFWENHPSTTGSGTWYRLTSTADEAIPTGTVTNSTLRWDGSQWVETAALLVTDAGTGTATLAANTTVTGTLEVTGNTTLTADLYVGANTTASGTLTANSTTTLNAALVDALGNAGTDGQILSTTGTSTNWVDNFAPVAGTATNTTLRWNGTAWVEDDTFLNSGTGTATFASNITATGTLEVTGNTTLTADLYVGANTTASGTLTANSTTTLKAALVDSFGNEGTDGQILSSTGTSTQWVDANTATLATMTATGNVTSTVSLLLLEPSSTMTVTLANASNLPTGFELKIRRNQGYTGSSDLITLEGSGGQTIDGAASRNLNVGYQSITLVNIGGAWISVD